MQLLEAGPANGRTIALVVPRWTDADNREPQGTPFRTMTIGAAFLEAGYHVVFFDQEQDLDLFDRFEDFLAHLDGATAVYFWFNELYPSNQCTNSFSMAQRIRERWPDLPTIVGGEFISICPPELFDFDAPVDYWLRGYGEVTAVELAERLATGRSHADVPGLVWRVPGGVEHNAPSSKPKMRSSYLELFKRVDMTPYIQRGGVLGNDQPTLTIALGRGCTKGCAFCTWSEHPSSILGADEHVELMLYLRDRYGVRQFHLAELDWFMSKRRALELARRLRDEGPDVHWFALGSPIDLVSYSDEDWDLLYAGGLRKVEIGSESASSRMLEIIGKRHAPEDIFTITMKMIERGIMPMNNFLFGFPRETRADRRASLQMIARLARVTLRGNHFTYRYYQPSWDTPLGREALAHLERAAPPLDQWLATRDDYIRESARTLPWLDEASEREVKQLVNHDLPLATSQLQLSSKWSRAIYKRLRRRAQDAVLAGENTSRLDRWTYDRVIRSKLDQTYVR